MKLYEIRLKNPVSGQYSLRVVGDSVRDAKKKLYDIYNITKDDYYGPFLVKICPCCASKGMV